MPQSLNKPKERWYAIYTKSRNEKKVASNLEEKGIEVIIGAPMDSPESLTNQYLSGTLVTGANVCDH